MDKALAANLANALYDFAGNKLKNGVGFEPFEDLGTEGGATVNVRFDHRGNLRIKKAETFQSNVQTLEEELKNTKNELKQAKKTVSEQETTIENLTAQIQTQTATTQETEEVEEPQRASIRKVRRPTA